MLIWGLRFIALFFFASGLHSIIYPGRSYYLILRIFSDVDDSVISETRKLLSVVAGVFLVIISIIFFILTFSL